MMEKDGKKVDSKASDRRQDGLRSPLFSYLLIRIVPQLVPSIDSYRRRSSFLVSFHQRRLRRQRRKAANGRLLPKKIAIHAATAASGYRMRNGPEDKKYIFWKKKDGTLKKERKNILVALDR